MHDRLIEKERLEDCFQIIEPTLSYVLWSSWTIREDLDEVSEGHLRPTELYHSPRELVNLELQHWATFSDEYLYYQL